MKSPSIEQLMRLCEDNQMTIHQLGKAAGVNLSTLYRHIRQDYDLPTQTILAICDAMGIRPYEFWMTDDDWAALDEYARGRGGRT